MQPPCTIEEELGEDDGSGTGDLKAVLLQRVSRTVSLSSTTKTRVLNGVDALLHHRHGRMAQSRNIMIVVQRPKSSIAHK